LFWQNPAQQILERSTKHEINIFNKQSAVERKKIEKEVVKAKKELFFRAQDRNKKPTLIAALSQKWKAITSVEVGEVVKEVLKEDAEILKPDGKSAGRVTVLTEEIDAGTFGMCDGVVNVDCGDLMGTHGLFIYTKLDTEDMGALVFNLPGFKTFEKFRFERRIHTGKEDWNLRFVDSFKRSKEMLDVVANRIREKQEGGNDENKDLFSILEYYIRSARVSEGQLMKGIGEMKELHEFPKKGEGDTLLLCISLISHANTLNSPAVSEALQRIAGELALADIKEFAKETRKWVKDNKGSPLKIEMRKKKTPKPKETPKTTGGKGKKAAKKTTKETPKKTPAKKETPKPPAKRTPAKKGVTKKGTVKDSYETRLSKISPTTFLARVRREGKEVFININKGENEKKVRGIIMVKFPDVSEKDILEVKPGTMVSKGKK